MSSPSIKKKWLSVISVLVVLIVFSFYNLLPNDFGKFVADVLDGGDHTETRLDIWKKYFRHIKEYNEWKNGKKFSDEEKMQLRKEELNYIGG